MDDAASRPGQQRRHDEADALAGPRGGEAKDMLRPVMAQIVAIVSAEQDAIRAEQTGGSNLAIFRPSRRAVGGDIAGFEIGRASCRERVCRSVELSVAAGSLKKK